MDLKALMQKLETINTTEIVTESVETKKVITESVATIRYSAEPVFTSSIARSLAEEFGYALDEEGGMGNDDPNNSAVADANAKRMQADRAAKDAAAGKVVGSGTTPAPAAAGQAASPAAAAPAAKPGVFDRVSTAFQKNNEKFAAKQAADAAANSPAGMAAAKANLTPSQLKWLGGAVPSPEILQRMPAAQPGEKPAGAAFTPPATGLTTSDGKPVLDGNKQPVATGSTTAAMPAVAKPPAGAAPAPGDNPEAAMGAGNGTAPVAANKPAAPEDNPEAAMGAGNGTAPVAANKPAAAGQAASPAPQKVDPNQADRDDAEQGAAMRANAAGGNSTSAATGVGNPGEEAAAELAKIKKNAGLPAAPAGVQAQGDDEGNTMITRPDGTTMVVGPDGNAIKPGSNPNLPTNKAQAAAVASGAQDDVTGVDKAVAANAAAPAAPTQAASPAAPTQAASPAAAKPKVMAKSDPAVLKIQQDLIAKGAKIKADGVMGDATRAAQKQFGGGQAASPTAKPAAPAAGAPAPSLINRFRASRNLPTSEAVSVPTTAQVVQAKDDQILAIIRNIRI